MFQELDLHGLPGARLFCGCGYGSYPRGGCLSVGTQVRLVRQVLFQEFVLHAVLTSDTCLGQSLHWVEQGKE